MTATLTPNAMTVLEKRYLMKKRDGSHESPESMFARVAINIAAIERDVYGKSKAEAYDWQNKFYDVMRNLEFLPNSPTLMNAGRELQQLAACFVLPVEDSIEGIFESVKNAALIHQSGGGTGFSFSRLRPAGDPVKKTNGTASGPVSFMRVFNAATEAIKQGGARRGANMGILRVDHPDILEFIDCKRDHASLSNFNISVAITDAFMQAYKEDKTYDLINPHTGKKDGELKARDVMEKLARAAWESGEPGVIFLDRINEDNPTPQLGEIESTNPCGEVPLLPYEACVLGSINLAKMVRITKQGEQDVDWLKLRQVVEIAVRFLDNTIDASVYPLAKIEEMVKQTRKIGLGVMGFADMLVQLGVPYHSEAAVKMAELIMSQIDEYALHASLDIADERGIFPAWQDNPDYGQPCRNATCTTIAPTGSISIIAGCSSGIEPYYSLVYQKNVVDTTLLEINPYFETWAKNEPWFGQELVKEIERTGSIQHIKGIPYRELFVTAHDIDPLQHLRIQATFQKHTDNAVSKTINMRQSATVNDVLLAYEKAYELGCKGVTIYRDRSRSEQVYVKGSFQKESTPGTPVTIPIHPNPIAPRHRPETTEGITTKFKIGGCGNLYVTVNKDEKGACEVFTNTGEKGCTPLSEALSRLISLSLRSGIDLEAILRQLKGRVCTGCIIDQGETRVLSCPDAIGKTLEKFVKGHNKYELPVALGPVTVDVCPECHSAMIHTDGCMKCLNCGYTRCG